MNNSLPKSKLVPISEAAQVLGVSIDTIRRWDKKGLLHSARSGKNRYFSIFELEKIKFGKPLPISAASKYLGISQTTLRRIEDKGLIKPDRNEAGERIYDREALEKFLNSEYFLRQKKIEQKILEPFNPEELAESPTHKVLNVLQQETRQEVFKLLLFRKIFYISSLSLVGSFILLISLITILFLLFPAQTGNFFGYKTETKQVKSGKQPNLADRQVLGVKYTAPTSFQVLGVMFKPFSQLSLQIVKQISPKTYQEIVPTRRITDINDVLRVDEQGNLIPKFDIKLPDPSYLKVEDKDGQDVQLVQQIINQSSASATIELPSCLSSQILSWDGIDWVCVSQTGLIKSVNSLTGALTISGAGINAVSSSGTTITITGSEADTLSAVVGRGATTTTAVTFGQVDTTGNVGLGKSLTVTSTGIFSAGIKVSGHADLNTLTISGNIGIGGSLTVTSAPVFSLLGSGIVQSNSLGGLSSGAVNLASSTFVSGILGATNGGTGQSSWTTGDLLYASGTNTLSKLGIGSASQVLTVSSGLPSWATVSSSQWTTSAPNIYFLGTTGAGNVGVGNTYANYSKLQLTGSGTGTGITFQTLDSSGTQRFTILDNGNVGIGTTGPGAPLSVFGSVGIGNTGSGGFAVSAAPSNGLAVQGNVGIGASTANSALTVNGGASIGTYNITAPPNGLIVEGNVGIGFTSPSGLFQVGGQNPALYVASATGNVGMGIANPNNRLEIAVNSTADPSAGGLQGISILNQDTTINALSGILFWSYDSGGSSRHGGAIVAGKETSWPGGGGNYPGFLSFWTRPTSGSEAERVRIDSAGNVGIGTSFPSQIFQVNPSGTSSLVFTSGGNLGIGFTSPNIRLLVTGGNVGIGTSNVAGAALQVNGGGLFGWGTTSSVLSSGAIAGFNGNVGVGTTSPVGALHVVGQCVAEGTRIRRKRKGSRGKGEEDWEEVPVEDIKPDDEVLSLDDKTGKFEWHKVEKTMDMGIQQVFRLETEEGKWIETTSNHPYLVRGLFEESYINNIQDGYYNEEYTKSFYGSNIGFNQPFIKSFFDFSFGFRFSSSHNLMTFGGMFFNQFDSNNSQKDSNENQRSGDLSSIKNFPNFFSIHSDNLSKITPISKATIASISAFVKKNTSTVTNPGDVNTKPNQAADRLPLIPERTLYKDFILTTLSNTKLPVNQNQEWIKVHQLKIGMEIATVNGWEKITAITKVDRKQTYDLQIEGTHNFLANNIVAHNTYINGSTGIGAAFVNTTTPPNGLAVQGNVGIGVTTANNPLFVNGAASIGSNNNIAAPANGLLVQGNVGIGTTGLGGNGAYNLDVWGTARITGNTTINGTLTTSSTSSFGGNLTLSSGQFLAPDGTVSLPSYSFTNSTSTGIFSPSANALGFSTNGSSRLTVTSGGNVGIGFTTPTSLFQVNSGSTAFTVSSTGNVGVGASLTVTSAPVFSLLGSGIVQSNSLGGLSSGAVNLASSTFVSGILAATNGGTGQSSWTTGDILYASGTNALTKLGIGSASQVLTVSSGLPSWADAGSGSSQWTTSAPNIYFMGTTGAGNVGIGNTFANYSKLQLTGSGTGTGLTFQTLDSAGTQRFSILDNGNVGIGTTNPGGALVVSSGNVGIGFTSPDRKLQIALDLSPVNTIAGYLGANGSQLDITGSTASTLYKKLVLGLDTTNNIGFIQAGNNIGVGNTASYNLLLNPVGGNVGIGWSVPTSTLHVRTQASDQKGLIVRGNTGGTSAIQPNDSAISSSLKAWYKADAITGLNDGDAVSPWNDSSGNSYTLTESTNKPTYKTSIINGQPIVRFDGTNDILTSTAISNLISASAFTVFAVAKATTITGSDTAYYNNSTLFMDHLGYFGISYHNNPRVAVFNFDTGDDFATSNSVTTGSFYVIRARHAGGNLYMSVNGESESSTASGNTGTITGSFRVGRSPVAGTFLNGDVAEIIIYNATLTAAQIAGVEKYLANKYALSVSAGSPTANLAEFQNDSGTLLSGVDPNGYLINLTSAGTPSTSPVTGSQVYDTTNNKICVYNAAWKCSAALSDYAEWAPAEPDVGIGDLVTITYKPNLINDPEDPFMLGKTRFPYDTKMIGVVSKYAEDANSANGYKKAEHYKAIALAGRVPVKVSTESGVIKKGDYLTSSSIPGVAMKATHQGQVIGKALEDFPANFSDNTTPGVNNCNSTLGVEVKCGQILAFIQPTFADPQDLLNSLVFDTKGRLMVSEIVTKGVTIVEQSKGLDVGGFEIATNSAQVKLSDLLDLKDKIASISAQLDLLEKKQKNIFEAMVEFLGNIIFHGNITFLGETTFKRIIFDDKDTGGFAIIQKGADKVEVVFDKEYQTTPLVNTSITLDDLKEEASQSAMEKQILDGDIKFIVTKRNTKGFTIKLNKSAPVDLKFSWSALAVKDVKVVISRQLSDIRQDTLGVQSASSSASPSKQTSEVSLSTSEVSTASVSATPKALTIKINNNELGFLRVREEAGVSSAEVGQVLPGATYQILVEKDGWYKIEHKSDFYGWVLGSYVTIQ